jgi:uncharacterized protein YdiU (UPF0061 family)
MQNLVFDNRFVRELPGEPEDPSGGVRQVQEVCWSAAPPTPVRAPKLLVHSAPVAALIGISEPEVQSELFAQVFSGNALVPGMEPVAARYGGHQFGVWAGQLGDGRAISLGEVLTPSGARCELQLKGAGRTPYSRSADGRAVLRSSIREFLCSEAMHHLGVPTTRALSLVTTGESVVRDMLYDGNPEPEPGAIVCRVAPSFLRLGNWEILAASGEHDLLRRLTEFAIQRDFPHLDQVHAGAEANVRYGAWFREICERTADLMVQWMRVGFVHGVMNTDNLSILGLTLDYGPYGWVEDFDPDWTPNTTDAGRRRYRFGQQPAVAQWNLARFGEALLPLISDTTVLEAGLEAFATRYNAGYLTSAAAKFGIVGEGAGADSEVRALVLDGFRLLNEGEMDFTLFFRALADVAADPKATRDALSAREIPEPLHGVFYDEGKQAAVTDALLDWIVRWQGQVGRWMQNRTPEAIQARMNRVNPRFILRNWIVQEVIEATEMRSRSAALGSRSELQWDPAPVMALLERLRTPYDPHHGDAHWVARRPEWARHKAGCSMLSCSS